MSSKMNHKKRPRYSESMKGGAFRASGRQAYYRELPNKANAGLLSRLFHRKTPQQSGAVKEITQHREG